MRVFPALHVTGGKVDRHRIITPCAQVVSSKHAQITDNLLILREKQAYDREVIIRQVACLHFSLEFEFPAGSGLMRRGPNLGKNLVATVALVAVGAGLYAGWKVYPYYATNFEFKAKMDSRVRIEGGDEERTGALGEAIYRDAQDEGVPLRRDDIQVDYGPTGSQVTADYVVSADLGFCQIPLRFHLQSPEPKQFVSVARRRVLAAMAFLAGIYWFFQGFGLFRKYRVIADTPLMPIRGVAMGRVQIRGKAVGEKTLLSPVSNQPCFLYKVDIERWTQGRSGSGRWSRYLTDKASVGFYLEDQTGNVMIAPQSAELDLEETYQCEINRRDVLPPGEPWRPEKTEPNRPGIPASDSELRRYVSRVAAGMDTAIFQGADKPSPPDPGSKRRRSLWGLGESLASLPELFRPAGLDIDGGSPGELRLTEYCVVPQGLYDITGTCMINPDSKNDSDRQRIAQGQNDSTFLISNQAEKDLEQDLHVRAWQHILGGGMLAIGGMAVLLEAFGLIL